MRNIESESLESVGSKVKFMIKGLNHIAQMLWSGVDPGSSKWTPKHGCYSTVQN